MVDGGNANKDSPFSISWCIGFANVVLDRYMKLPDLVQERLAHDLLIVAAITTQIKAESVSLGHDLTPWDGQNFMADLPEILLQDMLHKNREIIAGLKKDVNTYYDKYRESQSESAKQIGILNAKLAKAQMKLWVISGLLVVGFEALKIAAHYFLGLK